MKGEKNPIVSQDRTISLVHDKKPANFTPLLFQYESYWGSLQIKKEDVDRVKAEDGWINDEIMNFCILRVIEKRTEIFSFPSHFYNFLYEQNKSYSYEQSQIVANLSKYQVDIFEKEVLLIPINYSYHWSLVVVIRPLWLVRGRTDANGNHGMIFFLDSLSYHTREAVILREQVLRFLWSEWQSYNRLTYSSYGEDSSFENVCEFIYNSCSRCHVVKTPSQKNGNDCGIFVIKYVENFLNHWPMNTADINEVLRVLIDVNNFISQEHIYRYGREFLLELINEYSRRLVELVT